VKEIEKICEEFIKELESYYECLVMDECDRLGIDFDIDVEKNKWWKIHLFNTFRVLHDAVYDVTYDDLCDSAVKEAHHLKRVQERGEWD
jgi:hypothetical protein